MFQSKVQEKSVSKKMINLLYIFLILTQHPSIFKTYTNLPNKYKIILIHSFSHKIALVKTATAGKKR
jgi:hypothetical protein